jgi:hypothetical protein
MVTDRDRECFVPIIEKIFSPSCHVPFMHDRIQNDAENHDVIR